MGIATAEAGSPFDFAQGRICEADRKKGRGKDRRGSLRCGRDDSVGVSEREQKQERESASANTGVLRCAQNDDEKLATANADSLRE